MGGYGGYGMGGYGGYGYGGYGGGVSIAGRLFLPFSFLSFLSNMNDSSLSQYGGYGRGYGK